LGIVERMGSDRTTKIMLYWSLENRKRKRKPREQWIDGVRRSIISKNLREEDADGREMWLIKIVLGEKSLIK
jgi:hypothetical protein